MSSRMTLLIGFVLSSSPLVAFGQQNTGRPIQLFFGAAAGGGAFPGAFDPQCGSGLDGRTPAISFDIRAGAVLGNLRVETRTSTQSEFIMEDCLHIAPSYVDGVHTYRTSPVSRGNVNLTDFRAGYVIGDGALRGNVTGGAAWVWSAGLPALVAGAGIALGDRVRVGLDFDWISYRLPWHVITTEWRDGAFVQELDRVEETDWRSGYSVRLRLEVAPLRTR